MFGKQLFEEVSAKISETIANSPAKDMEKNVKAMLGSAFNRMDLVTREEFDIQQQVLIKTRTKLVELEERLAKLETALDDGGSYAVAAFFNFGVGQSDDIEMRQAVGKVGFHFDQRRIHAAQGAAVNQGKRHVSDDLIRRLRFAV